MLWHRSPSTPPRSLTGASIIKLKAKIYLLDDFYVKTVYIDFQQDDKISDSHIATRLRQCHPLIIFQDELLMCKLNTSFFSTVIETLSILKSIQKQEESLEDPFITYDKSHYGINEISHHLISQATISEIVEGFKFKRFWK
jgi:predicted small secreted protein